jgi:hypothetical protein
MLTNVTANDQRSPYFLALAHVVESRNLALREVNKPLKLGVACETMARQPMEKLVKRVEHDSNGSLHHLREKVPTNLTLSELARYEYLVSGRLPLNFHVLIGTLAELATNYPAHHEWLDGEPINANNHHYDVNRQPGPGVRIRRRQRQDHPEGSAEDGKGEYGVHSEAEYRTAPVAKVVAIPLQQFIGGPTESNCYRLFHVRASRRDFTCSWKN